MTNKNLPETSVLLSTYNNESTIANAVESILKQTYEDFELLIVDDSSSDRTKKILKEFDDSRIKIFNNKNNIGLTKSLNLLIRNARGKFLARQDGDDFSLTKRLSIQREFLSNTNYKICSTRARVISTQKKIPGYSHFLPQHLLFKFKNPHIHGSLFMEKSIIDLVGGYDENFYYSQDYKLYCDLRKINVVIKRINNVLYYLNTEGNISSIKKEKQSYYFECAKKNRIP